MRHLQLSKHLYRNQNTLPVIKSTQLSIGAANHTLLVRSLQLAVLLNQAPQMAYADNSERDVVYPLKGYTKSQTAVVTGLLSAIAKNLADNNIVQLRQTAASGQQYRLRFIRCNLTDRMRQLNERLPDFDFDPYTINSTISLSASGTKENHERLLRLSGLPIRLGRKATNI